MRFPQSWGEFVSVLLKASKLLEMKSANNVFITFDP